MGIFFGLAAALSWGTSDFLGGRFSTKYPAFTVAFIAQVAAFVLLVLLIVAFQPEIRAESVWWGLAAGGFTSLGAVALYQGLATGDSAVVATLSACGATVPVVFAFATGDAPNLMQTVGIALALAGTVVVSLPPPGVGFRTGHHLRPVLFGLGAAVGFGVFFVLVDAGTDRDSDALVVIGAARGGGMVIIGTCAMATRSLIWPGRDVPRLVGMSIIDVAANGFFALASNRGNLAVSSVLSSLYPVQTLVLSRFFTNERFTRLRILGASLAFAGVAAITVG
jgi:drug/metabolite transporter (DMT)-like permease